MNLKPDACHNLSFIFKLKLQDIDNSNNKLFVSFVKIILPENIVKLRMHIFVLAVIILITITDYLINIREHN